MSRRRNRINFIVGAVIVLAFAGLFARLTAHALYVRSVTGSVFNKYVIDKGIGRAEISDDASGFQTDFCVLHLNHPIPVQQLQRETYDLMYQYHNLDGGTSLTIEYKDPKSNKIVIESDAFYRPQASTVDMTLSIGGQKRFVSKAARWDAVDGS